MKTMGAVLAVALASTMLFANVSHAKHKKQATKGGEAAAASGTASGGGKAHGTTHGHGKGKHAAEGAAEGAAR